jgi:hypothetical protein
MKKYTKRKDTRTLNCSKYFGPIFGDDDFYIQENMKKLYIHPYRTFLDKNELTDININEFIEYSVKDFEVIQFNNLNKSIIFIILFLNFN